MTLLRACRIHYLLLALSVTLSAQDACQKPRIPPGQRVVENFPLLHYADIPDLDQSNWLLKISGEVKIRLMLDWKAFTSLEKVKSVSDFHCVTGWTKLDLCWEGVRIRQLLEMAGLKEGARFITFKSADGYSTSLPISSCTGDDDLLAVNLDGSPLDKTQGGPVRVVIPAKYGYKSALWVTEIIITEQQQIGLWENRGYHNNADPWKEERFNFQ